MRWAETRTGGRSRRTVGSGRRGVPLLAALPLVLLLAACGGNAGAPPAAQTTPTAQPPTGSPAAVEPRTLGELADRVDAAWAGVASFRSVFVAGQPWAAGSPTAGSPAASPVSPAPSLTIVREVALPDRQRLQHRSGDAVVSEAVIVGDRVYVRGAAARVLLPGADPATWVEGELAAVAPLAAADPLLARLVAPIESPLAAVPDNLRPQELRPLGPVDVGGRACQAYGAANTTEVGTRVDITIAVDPAGLPCFLETRAGEAGGRETFESFDQPLDIAPPAASTPVVPPASPATPAGRD